MSVILALNGKKLLIKLKFYGEQVVSKQFYGCHIISEHIEVPIYKIVSIKNVAQGNGYEIHYIFFLI